MKLSRGVSFLLAPTTNQDILKVDKLLNKL